MADGIYVAASGGVARQKQLDKVSHNLANVDTAGYRARKVAFEEVMSDAMGLTRQVAMAEESVAHREGVQKQTGQPLDLAIEGRGFFLIEAEQGRMLTRDGRFRVTSEGKVVTAQGEAVLNWMGGEIWVPGEAEELMIDARGRISDELGQLDRIGVYDVERLEDLEAVGPTRFKGEEAALMRGPTVRQGMLESANVDAVEGMTDLIALQRNFEVMQRLMQTHRDLDKRAIQLGSVR